MNSSHDSSKATPKSSQLCHVFQPVEVAMATLMAEDLMVFLAESIGLNWCTELSQNHGSNGTWLMLQCAAGSSSPQPPA